MVSLRFMPTNLFTKTNKNDWDCSFSAVQVIVINNGDFGVGFAGDPGEGTERRLSISRDDT